MPGQDKPGGPALEEEDEGRRRRQEEGAVRVSVTLGSQSLSRS